MSGSDNNVNEPRPSSADRPPEPSSTRGIARSDTALSDLNDYLPLPSGRWLLDFHGNCPRCRHTHSAVKVKVKVSDDAKQVSYVNCDVCKQKWAAFGGRNTTRISLLSVTSTNPDVVRDEVRNRLIKIVKAATAQATLDAIPEPVTDASAPVAISPVVSRITVGDVATCLTYSPRAIEMVSGADTQGLATDNKKHSPDTTNQGNGCISVATSPRGAPQSFFIKLKRNIHVYLHGPQWIRFKQNFRSKTSTKLSTRRPGTQPVQEVLQNVPDGGETIEQSSPKQPRETSAEAIDTNGSRSGKLQKTNSIASEFVQSLDISALNDMDDKARANWLRRTYKEFLARYTQYKNPSPTVRLPPSEEVGQVERRPEAAETIEQVVIGAGSGLRDTRNRDSGTEESGIISIDDRNSEVTTAYDTISVNSYPRFFGPSSLAQERRGLGIQRPQSLPPAPRASPHFRHGSIGRDQIPSAPMQPGSSRHVQPSNSSASDQEPRATEARSSAPTTEPASQANSRQNESESRHLFREPDAASTNQSSTTSPRTGQ